MSNPAVCLITALPAEARPLKQRFSLQRATGAMKFPLYRDGTLSLVISGVGKHAARDAVHWLGERPETAPNAIWVNLGIAGHPTRPLGQAVLATEIEDGVSGQKWLTNLPADLPCDCDRLLTFSQPKADYDRDALYDMEASGFYPAARHYAAAGRVHCLKVISDNRQHTSRHINGKLVSQLIGERLDILERLIRQLEANL